MDGECPQEIGKFRNATQKISEVVTINADDAEPALYVINYETGGLVILSADNRVEPILAYSESNYFESENVTYPEGLVEWMDEQKAYVSSVRTGKGEQSPQVKKLWDNPNIIIKQGGDDEDNPAPGEPGECDPKYYEYGPLLTAEWNQCFGFNEQMAPAPTSCMLCPWNDRALAGCVPLAIAQIMWYYNYPTNYNWAAMPATFGAPATQDLIRDIWDVIPSFQKAIDCDGTWVSSAHNTANVFLAFGYSSATKASYNYSTVYASIQNNRPVLLSGASGGSGHMWVCDGARRSEYLLGDCEDDPQVWYHYYSFYMRWGWGSNWNGWFSWANFNPNSSNFNSNRQMVYNIVP